MPFPGNLVPAPVMAARQGMKDIALSQVNDQGQPIAQYVNGALTGKGSGLLTSTTITNAAPTTGALTQATQAAGKAMSLGSGTLNGASAGPGGTPVSAAAWQAASGGGGGMAAQSLGAAQTMMGQSPASLGSAAAMAGSGLASPSITQAGSMASGAAASSASAGGAGIATLPGLQPGAQPAPPQFTPLPAIPSMPALQGVLAKLGGMVAGGGVAPGTPDALTGAGGSGATAAPASQFDGTAPADLTETEFD